MQVVPLLRLRQLGNRVFTYLVPSELEEAVQVGSVVRVPFGARVVQAVVVSETALDVEGENPSGAEAAAGGLRPLEAVSAQRIPPDLLDLATQVSSRFLAPLESCLRLVVPPQPFPKPRGHRATWVRRVPIPTNQGGPSAGRTPDTPCTAAAEYKLTPKQQALLAAVPPKGGPIPTVLAQAGVGKAVLQALVNKGILALEEEPPQQPGSVPSFGCSSLSGRPSVEQYPELWPEQKAALDGLVAAYESGEFAYRLLWGVTGSGKTEVYLRLIERVLEDGRGALLLVPEIALTPQTIARVRARFGGWVGVLHSGLRRAERAKEYQRIAAGLAPVVVGARSAIFAPLPRLGLVILDEAHDTSYKQEEEPRYHAATVARLRLAAGGLLVEGTATPTVESMQNPRVHLRLARRAAGCKPSLEVVDMRRQGAAGLLAPRSYKALAETLRRGEQAIVLLNRRGYAAYVHCEACGHVMKCDDCELSLTYHSSSRRLVCHHCGRVYTQPARCPACDGPPLTRGAPGTERLDQELRALVPQERVFRLDSDVAMGSRRVESILASFGNARPAVLVGTQMVAKGHDFPDVTLVVVADADTGLYVPDFRATERTFQLLTQVAGRAGRADRPGRVLIQTWNPEVPCIRMALQRDEQGFYAEELRIRKRLGYPPFTELIRLLTLADDPAKARAGALYLGQQLSPHFGASELRGPVRLPTVRGKHRWHLLVASAQGARMRALVGKALAQLSEPYRRRGVLLLADVDPLSFG